MSVSLDTSLVSTVRVLDSDAIDNPEWHYGLHFTTPYGPDLRLLFNGLDSDWIIKAFTDCCNQDYEVKLRRVYYMDALGTHRESTEYPLYCTKCGEEVAEDRRGSHYDTDLKDWLLRHLWPHANVLEAEFVALGLRDHLKDLVELVKRVEYLARFRGRTEVIDRLRVKFGEAQDVYGDYDEYE